MTSFINTYNTLTDKSYISVTEKSIYLQKKRIFAKKIGVFRPLYVLFNYTLYLIFLPVPSYSFLRISVT